MIGDLYSLIYLSALSVKSIIIVLVIIRQIDSVTWTLTCHCQVLEKWLSGLGILVERGSETPS